MLNSICPRIYLTYNAPGDESPDAFLQTANRTKNLPVVATAASSETKSGETRCHQDIGAWLRYD